MFELVLWFVVVIDDRVHKHDKLATNIHKVFPVPVGLSIKAFPLYLIDL